MTNPNTYVQSEPKICEPPKARIVGWLLQEDTACDKPGCNNPATVLALLRGDDYDDTALCDRHIPAGTSDLIAAAITEAISAQAS